MSRVARVACFFLVFAAPFASGISRTDLDKVMDFSVTLKTVAAAAAGEVVLPPNKLFALNGTVSEITFVDKAQASFHARITLISGEWLGVEDVKMFSCYVDFSGPEFFTVFPARAPKDTTNVVLADTRVLIIARAVEVTTSPTGENLVVLEGQYLRVLH